MCCTENSNDRRQILCLAGNGHEAVTLKSSNQVGCSDVPACALQDGQQTFLGLELLSSYSFRDIVPGTGQVLWSLKLLDSAKLPNAFS